MVTRKSSREIELMRIAGRIVALTHQELKKFIRPGISTKDIDDLAYNFIVGMDAYPSSKGYNGFPGSVCVSVNEVVVHGIPNKKKILKDGDIVTVDIVAEYKGYHGDSAWTYPVGNVSDKAKKLLKVTEEALYKGLEQAKPGNHLSDISHAIQSYSESFGFGVVREFTGHGIGSKMHEDPAIPNFGVPGNGIVLKPGMTLAIEPMICAGKKEVQVLSDGWTTVTKDKSLSAHFEHTIVITESGFEILTKL